MGQVNISSVSVSSGLNWSIKCWGQMTMDNICKLQCILNSIHTVLREAGPILSEHAQLPLFATDMCISQGWQQLQRKPAGGGPSPGPLEADSFFSFCLYLLEKVRWGSAGKKFKLIHGLTQGCASNSKHTLGHAGQDPAFPKANDNGGKGLWRFCHHFNKIWIDVETNCFCFKWLKTFSLETQVE